MIQITNLAIDTKDFKTRLLEPLSLKLYQDRPVTILGQTGSGKSLLAQAIIGLLPEALILTGKVQILGRVYNKYQLQALWGKQIVMLPQEPWRALDPLMMSYKQIAEVYETLHAKNEEAAFDLAVRDLEKIDLKQSAFKRVGQLSGGMAQRLAVQTATAGGAKLILADEPTKGLDISRRDDIVKLLKQHSYGGGLLTITHDIEVARQIGGEIIVMKKGVVVESGLAQSILDAPQHEYTKKLIAADPRYWSVRNKTDFADKPVILQVNDLSIGRSNNVLASNINFHVHKGEVVGIVGDSGCGKSTLGDTLLGLIKPLSGTIDKLATNAKPFQWLKLFQDPPSAFASSVSLWQLLDDLIRLHAVDRAKVASLMHKLKLQPELLQRKSTEVSGGELQRFAILRALLVDPVFLFADEPTSRLDPIVAKEVIDLLIKLATEQGCAVLLVSHDPFVIEKSCDQVIRLTY